MKATIKLEYEKAEIAAAVANAISPDNLKCPAGMKVKTERQDCCVVSEIELEGRLVTFTATIDDLLAHASTAEKALRVLKSV